MKYVSLKGQKFGRLTVFDDGSINKFEVERKYECLCECGNTKRILGSRLKNGTTKSCGCLQRDKAKEMFTTHGCAKVSRSEKERAIYSSWDHMRQRCLNPNNDRFGHYGGRGIQVSAEWATRFDFFYDDMEETWFKGATIDRIDNDGHYNRLNCRWATRAEQNNNKDRYEYV